MFSPVCSGRTAGAFKDSEKENLAVERGTEEPKHAVGRGEANKHRQTGSRRPAAAP